MSSIIGLTGGIGAGKSTVAAMLAERGAVVIDADQVAHDAYAPGTEGFDAVIDRFGRGVIAEDGSIDRAALGQIVFNDREALGDLNAIIHPLVRKEVARRLLEVQSEDPDAVVVLEAALMTETGWAGGAGTLWVVIAAPDIALKRLISLRGMDEAEARLRIASQASNEERRRVGTLVIENDGTLEDLELEVDRAWRAHLEAAGG